MNNVTVSEMARQKALEYLEAMWREKFGNVTYGWMRDEEAAVLSGKRDQFYGVQAFAKFEAEIREECAAVAEGHKALGYMSDRERDYCHEHGEEIAAAIRQKGQP